MTNSAQGVDYPVSTQPLAPLPLPLRLPGSLNSTLGKGLGREPLSPPTQRCLQLQQRKEAPACSVPRRIWLRNGCSCGSAVLPGRTPCLRASGDSLEQGGMRAFLSPPVANATACVRDPSAQKGFRRVAEPGCTPPDTLMEFGNCKRVEALEKGGVAEPGW